MSDNGDPENMSFDLPEEVLHVLPSDPFTQLDLARKITSIALYTRVSALESEASVLRAQLTDRDNIIAELESHIQSLDASLADALDRLNRAEQEKETLVKENGSLSSTVNKLRRDVAKLEVFRKTLMQSLQEEEDGSTGVQAAVARELQSQTSLSVQSQDDDVTQPPSAYSSTQSKSLERRNSVAEDQDSYAASRPRRSPGLLLASQTTTPRLTPPGSPPSTTPSKTSKPTSPRRQSVSFSTSRGMFGSTDGGSQSGRPRIDGKEFFRQVRSRLSYEQFGAFLATVKELNSHKQTKEETLRKADEIFGPDNKDLYTTFEGLLTRNAS